MTLPQRRQLPTAAADECGRCVCRVPAAVDVDVAAAVDYASNCSVENIVDKCQITGNKNLHCEHSSNGSDKNYKNYKNNNKCNNMKYSIYWTNWSKCLGLMLCLIFCCWCDIAHAALSDVNLYIEPPAVRRGQSVALRCHYVLEGAPLYSVKYYRGNMEFFRHTPGEHPSIKVFQYPAIIVDENASNATQVVLRNVSFQSSGNFSCEVTADAPLYSTATAYAQMQVVQLPEKGPLLFTERTRYEPGDVLLANCSISPSRPRAELRFSINNEPMSPSDVQYIHSIDSLVAARISLKLQLQPEHFTNGANVPHIMNAQGGSFDAGIPSYITHGSSHGAGSLVLRCTAQVGDSYQEYKEIELGTPQKDPVPARVTLSSGSSFRNFFETYFSSSAGAVSPIWQRQTLALLSAFGALGAFHWLQTRRYSR